MQTGKMSKKKGSYLKGYRRAVQIGVTLAFILIPLLNHFRFNHFSGNFLSFNAAGLPLADPLAVLQITLKNYYLSQDLLIGAAIALVLATFLGTVFCSWGCPFGLFSELTQGLSRKVLDPIKGRPQAVSQSSFRLKLLLFGLGLSAYLVFSTTPVLNQLSLPAWYSRIFQFLFEQAHFSLAIIVLSVILFIEFLCGKRIWCRYVCPQSVLLILAKQLNPHRLKVGFNPDKCLSKKVEPCKQACSLGLDPKKLDAWLETGCNNCGDCVVVCQKLGRALEYGFRHDVPGSADRNRTGLDSDCEVRYQYQKLARNETPVVHVR